jgi:outer membrane receptor protein involved in Fe transport
MESDVTHFDGWRRGCAVLVAATVLGLPCVASAQPGSPEEPQARAASYGPDFFAPFNPVTAEDVVRRVPGFTLDNGLERRGFAGAAGNVLINGERPSSKTPISEQLSRISARDVLRVDVHAGGAVDLRGYALVVDVQLRPRQAGATNTYVVQAGVLEPGESVNPVVVATSAFRVGSTDVSLTIQAQPARRGRVEFAKDLLAANDQVIETGREYLQGSYYEYKLSGRLGWRPTADDVVNLTAQLTPSRDGRHTFSEVFSPTGIPLRTEDSKVVGDSVLAYELGADWERRLTARSSVKLLALASRRETGSDERYTTRPFAGGARSTLIQRASDSGEYIGRAVWTYRAGTAHTFDIGVEGAFNALDSALDIAVDTGAGPRPTPLPVANTRVEERRGEAYVTDVWRVSPDLSVEAGVTVETSRIRQSGDAEQARSFTFVKPRMVATWNRSPGDQLRLRLERDVAQLDFTEFASAVSLFDGTVDLGNPDLAPERTWRAQLDWERRLGPKALVTLSAFYERVEDVQDQIPVAGQFDAPGNIGDGRRYGVKLDVLAPLDRVGLPRGELRVRTLLQDTRVEDPVTGRSRRFSDETEWSYSVDLRQPLPSLKLAWGAILERADEVRLFRLRELRETGWDRPNLDAYVETTAIPRMVIRFTVADILLPKEIRERAFYAPDRSLDRNLGRLETRRAIGGFGTRSYTLRIAGRF